MATAQMAQMLDELMGKARNMDPEMAKDFEPKWFDDDVCRYFLASFCPHDMFNNTKLDLGPCNKVHDEALRKAYQESSRCGKLGYEKELYRLCERLVQDCNRKIARGKERLGQTPTQMTLNGRGDDVISRKREKLKSLTEEITTLLEETERLGNEGEVAKAKAMTVRMEELKREREATERNLEMAMQTDKELEVCNLCGALLIVNDVESRVNEHLNGKQHVGMGKLRDYVTAYEEKQTTTASNQRSSKDRQKGKDNGDASKTADSEKDADEDGKKVPTPVRASLSSRRRSRSRSRQRQNEKDRSSRDQPKEKERDRGRDRERERERERDRDRDRDRNRDRDRFRRRSRSRSRQRNRRSRSRDRGRRR